MLAPKSAQPARSYIILVLVGISDALVITLYIWLITFGTWTDWKPAERHYDELATSFLHGSLALEARPDPALLALPDPYDPAQRNGTSYIANMSLYQGQYYFYFGPAPAVLLLLLKTLFSIQLSDTALTLMFLIGMLLLQSVLLGWAWQSFFRAIPMWTIIPAMLGVGLTNPYPWLLLSANLNNAAITASQFFFLAGLCAALLGVKKSFASPLPFAMAGFFRAFSAGSRLTLLFPVASVCALLVVWAFADSKPERKWRKVSSTAVSLAIPLAAGLLALGLYNLGRFGSMLETGFYYQLTGQDLQANYHDVFSPVYIIQNSYNYFLTLPRFTAQFPFMSAVKGSKVSILSFIVLPKIYYSQELAGLLYLSPWLVFAVFPVVTLLRGLKRGVMAPDTGSQRAARLFNRLGTALLGSFAFALIPLLLFFWTATRYVLDFIPSLILLALIGFGQAVERTKQNSLARVFIILLGIALIAYSIIAASLIAMSVNSTAFKDLNPVLWRQLRNAFPP